MSTNSGLIAHVRHVHALMGRAQGQSTSALLTTTGTRTEGAFSEVFGVRRGDTTNGLLEGASQASPAALRELAHHEQLLTAGDLTLTIELLRENKDALSRAPRLQDLRALLASRLHKETRELYIRKRATTFEALATSPVLTRSEQVLLSRAVDAETTRALSLKPVRSRSFRASPPESELTVPLEVEMTRGCVARVYLHEMSGVLLNRVSGSEDALKRALGLSVYQRLSQEASGVWSTELPLGDLFKDAPLAGQEAQEHNLVALSSLMSRTHWRDFIRTEVTGHWVYGSSTWDENGRMIDPEVVVAGFRGDIRYRLARLLRKRTRAGWAASELTGTSQ